ncbi:MAG: hypothetical protein KAS95_02505 [Candidatus Heimdallarchaeota archaeon]|nr:hypothetical protein [Candidatus Heimdallarchaeota archaeon]
MEKIETDQDFLDCAFCKEESICPLCGNIILRELEKQGRLLGLCYVCGTVFWCDTKEIIKKLEGTRDGWGIQALLCTIP